MRSLTLFLTNKELIQTNSGDISVGFIMFIWHGKILYFILLHMFGNAVLTSQLHSLLKTKHGLAMNGLESSVVL